MTSTTMSIFVVAAAAAATLVAQPAAAQRRGGGGASHGAAVSRGGSSGRSHGAASRGGHRGSRPVISGRGIPRTNVVRPRVDRRTAVIVPPYRSHIDSGFGGLRAYRYPYYSYGYPGYYRGRNYSNGYGGYYGGYSSAYYSGAYGTHARVRILGAPGNGQVFVDGYFAGIVDDFDGVFQHLEVTPGPHQIEIRADGFAAVVVNVQAIDGRTIDFRAQMVPAVP